MTTTRLLRCSAVVMLALALLAVGGCSPLSVRRVEPESFYREQTRNSLSSDDVSDLTRTTLRRHDLLHRYEDDPGQALAALRQSLVDGRGDSEEVFALAELSLLYGKESGSRDAYLAAAVYAYAFLFPEDGDVAPNPFDVRNRIACDLYNRAIVEAFRDKDDSHVSLREGTYGLPFGLIDIKFDVNSLDWRGYRLVDLVAVGDLKISGLRNRYRTPGIGAPLAARPQPLDGTYDDEGLIGPHVRVPITALLRIEQPRRQILSDSLQARLEVRSTSDMESTLIGQRMVPLEAEPTAVLASTLEAERPWTLELAGFLGKVFALSTKPSLLRGGQPYQRGKIPVVFVHGTASSVFRWADMVNDLTADRRIRERFQFWFFMYDSGNPIAYSAYRLRKALSENVARLDPEGTDQALREMVVIGHSQGGLLTKMTAIDSGDRFWKGVSKWPFEEVRLSEATREMLREALFVKPLPFVKRLIFIATPHRGSYLAGPQFVRRLAARLVQMPSEMIALGTELSGLATLSNVSGVSNLSGLGSGANSRLSLERIPTSIDNMAPGNPFIRALSKSPIVAGVKVHSIIPVKQEENIEDGDDGVVKYRSAHIDGVESELVVHDSHSTQSNPYTIAEVQRILLLHAGQENPRLAQIPQM